MKKILTTSMFLLLFLVLAYNILMMPGNLGVNAPSYNDTVIYYLENAVNETGAVNLISAIITDYRGFDTLGETIVLFIAVVTVTSVLKPQKKRVLKRGKHHE
jgi:multisubunit Na+/H+ antiporter MnhB subunit